MSAKKMFQDAVKNALTKNGWNLKDEKFKVSFGLGNVNDNEILMVFDKNQGEIAVIAETFLSASPLQDFYVFLGRYLNLRLLLRNKNPELSLYSAITYESYENFCNKELFVKVLKRHQVLLIIYDFETRTVKSWKNRIRIMSPHFANKKDAKRFEKRVEKDL